MLKYCEGRVSGRKKGEVKFNNDQSLWTLFVLAELKVERERLPGTRKVDAGAGGFQGGKG